MLIIAPLTPCPLTRLPFPLVNTSTGLGGLLGELTQTPFPQCSGPLAPYPYSSMVAVTCPFTVTAGHGKSPACPLDHLMSNPFFASPQYVVAAALPPSDKYCNFLAGMVTVFFAARLFYWESPVPRQQL